MKTKSFITVAIIIALCTPSFAYKDNIHHTATGEAVKASSVTAYLRGYFGLDAGAVFSNGWFDKMTITEWIKTGGVKEDNFPRFLNHFFDPVTEKGIFFLEQQNSSKVWAKDLSSNDWDWASAREDFHSALTSTDAHVRETRLADTFRAVGQVMHLVEDLASPAHVRNDVHMPTIWDKDFYEEYTDKKFRPEDNVITYSGYPPVDLSTFSSFDTFWKNGGKGLAEFTNKNFLSRDTNIDDNAYPSPVPIGEWLAEETPDPDMSSVHVRYQQGYATDAYRPEMSAPIRKLASFSYFDFEMKKLYPDKAVYTLNDGVHREYAQFLVPRAVGYAAGILNYFFRGTMTLEPVTNGVSFRTVRVMAKNDTSTGEEMTGAGELTLVVRYRNLAESGTGSNRILLYPDDYYSYRTARLQLPAGIPRNAPVELAFDFSDEPLSANFADMTMQLVYKGKLGNEDGAVAVSSLTPVDGIYTDFHLSLPGSGVFAKAEGNTMDAAFNELRVTALADIPGGLSVPGGRFELALEYRIATSDPFQSLPVDTEPADAAAYIIRVSEKNSVNSLENGVPVELVFDLSSVTLPAKVTDVQLNLYYVADVTQKIYAVGFRDISEPTPVDVFNNADKVCVNGKWYSAGTPTTLMLRDASDNPIADYADLYAHDIGNIFFKAAPDTSPSLASANNYTISSPAILTGNIKRTLGYILTDYNFSYSNLEEWFDVVPSDPWYTVEPAEQHAGTAVKNQTDADGNYTWPAMFGIRGKTMWWGAGVVYDNANATPQQPDCSWTTLP